MEVHNAIKVYESLQRYRAHYEASFLQAHFQLLEGLMDHPRIYRKQGVWIAKGDDIGPIAPPTDKVP